MPKSSFSQERLLVSTASPSRRAVARQARSPSDNPSAPVTARNRPDSLAMSASNSTTDNPRNSTARAGIRVRKARIAQLADHFSQIHGGDRGSLNPILDRLPAGLPVQQGQYRRGIEQHSNRPGPLAASSASNSSASPASRAGAIVPGPEPNSTACVRVSRRRAPFSNRWMRRSPGRMDRAFRIEAGMRILPVLSIVASFSSTWKF